MEIQCREKCYQNLLKRQLSCLFHTLKRIESKATNFGDIKIFNNFDGFQIAYQLCSLSVPTANHVYPCYFT